MNLGRWDGEIADKSNWPADHFKICAKMSLSMTTNCETHQTSSGRRRHSGSLKTLLMSLKSSRTSLFLLQRGIWVSTTGGTSTFYGGLIHINNSQISDDFNDSLTMSSYHCMLHFRFQAAIQRNKDCVNSCKRYSERKYFLSISMII